MLLASIKRPIEIIKQAQEVVTERKKPVQGGDGARLRLRQHLFSLYIHPGPVDPGYGPTSLFHGREVPNRVQARAHLWLTRIGAAADRVP